MTQRMQTMELPEENPPAYDEVTWTKKDNQHNGHSHPPPEDEQFISGSEEEEEDSDDDISPPSYEEIIQYAPPKKSIYVRPSGIFFPSSSSVCVVFRSLDTLSV